MDLDTTAVGTKTYDFHGLQCTTCPNPKSRMAQDMGGEGRMRREPPVRTVAPSSEPVRAAPATLHATRRRTVLHHVTSRSNADRARACAAEPSRSRFAWW